MGAGTQVGPAGGREPVNQTETPVGDGVGTSAGKPRCLCIEPFIRTVQHAHSVMLVLVTQDNGPVRPVRGASLNQSE